MYFKILGFNLSPNYSKFTSKIYRKKLFIFSTKVNDGTYECQNTNLESISYPEYSRQAPNANMKFDEKLFEVFRNRWYQVKKTHEDL